MSEKEYLFWTFFIVVFNKREDLFSFYYFFALTQLYSQNIISNAWVSDLGNWMYKNTVLNVRPQKTNDDGRVEIDWFRIDK
ncbi:MAG: hypothetical protein QM751_15920 [Paludibacteraceae bacterium]